MKVIANISYLDKELNRQVAEGEVLEVTEERGKVLTTNQNGMIAIEGIDIAEVGVDSLTIEEIKAPEKPMKKLRRYPKNFIIV